jgi:hypothetical protein
MSNLKRSSEHREAEEACSKNQASAPTSPPPAGDRLGGSLPGAELATANSRGRSRAIITHLDLSERIEIQSGLRARDTQVTVALKLNRSAGAISMELKRKGGRAGYCATQAHAAALSRRVPVNAAAVISPRVRRCATRWRRGSGEAGLRRKSQARSNSSTRN